MAFCSECGKSVDKNAPFCNECGAKREVVGSGGQPQKPQKPPQKPEMLQQNPPIPLQGGVTQVRKEKKSLSSGKILGIVAVIALVGGLAWTFMPDGDYEPRVQGILDVENMTSEEKSDLKMAEELYVGFEDMLKGKNLAYVGTELTWVTDWEFDEKGKTMPILVGGATAEAEKEFSEELGLSPDAFYDMVAEQEKYLSVREYKKMIVELSESASATSTWGRASDFVLMVGEDNDGGLCIYAPEGNWGKALEIPTTLEEASYTIEIND